MTKSETGFAFGMGLAATIATLNGHHEPLTGDLLALAIAYGSAAAAGVVVLGEFVRRFDERKRGK